MVSLGILVILVAQVVQTAPEQYQQVQQGLTFNQILTVAGLLVSIIMLLIVVIAGWVHLQKNITAGQVQQANLEKDIIQLRLDLEKHEDDNKMIVNQLFSELKCNNQTMTDKLDNHNNSLRDKIDNYQTAMNTKIDKNQNDLKDFIVVQVIKNSN